MAPEFLRGAKRTFQCGMNIFALEFTFNWENARMRARFGLWARAGVSARGAAAHLGPALPPEGFRAAARPAAPAHARGAATFFHRGTRSQKLIVNINSRIYAYVCQALQHGMRISIRISSFALRNSHDVATAMRHDVGAGYGQSADCFVRLIR